MKTNLFNRQLLAVCVLCALLCSTFGVSAQTTRELVQEDGDKKPASQKRIALVIGNAAYTKAKPLANPANDAADMTKALKDVGFEVISGTNQNKRQMETAIREFGTKLAASGGVGLFYYAGHGIQVAGENYLVPVDADIPEEDEVSYSAVPISLVLGKMATAKNELNIVILDACRNNPFARSWTGYRDSSNSDGLAKISPPTGTLVLYATEPGKVASDGKGRNGLFTEALLRQIRQPNLEYDQLVKAVSADVWQKSNRQQLPWKEGNSLLDFYFVEAGTDVAEASNLLDQSKNGSRTAAGWLKLRETARILLNYESAFAFSEDFSAVTLTKTETKKSGFINKKGKEVIQIRYDFADSFSEGLAAVLIGDMFKGYWGFIDKTGKTVIPYKYNEASAFSEGLAAVKKGDYETGKWGYLNKTGKEIIPFKYDQALGFSEGLAAVKQQGKWSFIDKTGREVLPAKYTDASSFSEGLAPVKKGDPENGKWGFIDKTGKEIILAEYSDVTSFSEGLARVRVGDYPDGKFGFIDKTGKVVILPKYDRAFIFSGGFAYVALVTSEKEKAGILDKTGKEVIPLKYDDIWCFAFQNEGVFGVMLNGRKGFVDVYGNEYFDF